MPISRLLTQGSAQRVLAEKNFVAPADLKTARQRVKTHYLVKDRDLLTPPGAPADGDYYLMPAAGTLLGAWEAFALNDVVYWDGGLATPAWVKIPALVEGDSVDVADEDITLRWSGSAWTTPFESAFATLAALKAAPTAQLAPGAVVAVNGHTTAGDGGANSFRVLSGNAAANGYSNTLDGVVFQNTAGDRTFVMTSPWRVVQAAMIGILGANTALANGTAWTAFAAWMTARAEGWRLEFAGHIYQFDRELTVTDIANVQFIGVGSDATLLDFASATGTNGIRFVGASWLYAVENLEIRNTDLDCLSNETGGANPNSNIFNSTVRNCEFRFAGAHGFDCKDGFMLMMENCRAGDCALDGFKFFGFHTSTTVQTCWAIACGASGAADGSDGWTGNGWRINDIIYSEFSGCGADDSGNPAIGRGAGFYVTNIGSTVFTGCGAEANQEAAFLFRASGNVALLGSFGSTRNVRRAKLLGCYGNLNDLGVAARGGTVNANLLFFDGDADPARTQSISVEASEDTSAPVGTPSIFADGFVDIELLNNVLQRGISMSGFVTLRREKSVYNAQAIVFAGTLATVKIATCKDLFDTTESYSGILHIRASSARHADQNGNWASYTLLVGKDISNNGYARLLKVDNAGATVNAAIGLTAGAGVTHPSFTFALDPTTNELRATAVGSTGGGNAFYFNMFADGDLRLAA